MTELEVINEMIKLNYQIGLLVGTLAGLAISALLVAIIKLVKLFLSAKE